MTATVNAAGGSLREIAEELGLSHQRVHQIVGSEASIARPRRRHGHGLHLRFTRVARVVVSAAESEARTLGHERIGTEHLLLGVLAVEQAGAFQVLAEAGIDAAKVREAVVLSLGEGGEPRRRQIPFTRAAKRALEHALGEAAQLGSRSIGSEHLLLGLLAAEGSGARDLLTSLGADPGALRDATLALLAK